MCPLHLQYLPQKYNYFFPGSLKLWWEITFYVVHISSAVDLDCVWRKLLFFVMDENREDLHTHKTESKKMEWGENCVCQWCCAKMRNNAWSEMIEICIGFSHLWIFSFSCFVIRLPSSSFHVAFFLTQAINDTSIKREVNVKKLSYLHASWCRKPKFCSDHFVWDSFFCCCCCWLL